MKNIIYAFLYVKRAKICKCFWLFSQSLNDSVYTIYIFSVLIKSLNNQKFRFFLFFHN